VRLRDRRGNSIVDGKMDAKHAALAEFTFDFDATALARTNKAVM